MMKIARLLAFLFSAVAVMGGWFLIRMAPWENAQAEKRFLGLQAALLDLNNDRAEELALFNRTIEIAVAESGDPDLDSLEIKPGLVVSQFVRYNPLPLQILGFIGYILFTLGVLSLAFSLDLYQNPYVIGGFSQVQTLARLFTSNVKTKLLQKEKGK
jgi:hypothetical protein